MHSMHLVNRVQWSTVARKTTSGPSQGQEHDILGIANISPRKQSRERLHTHSTKDTSHLQHEVKLGAT
jgi:hypothetical protein